MEDGRAFNALKIKEKTCLIEQIFQCFLCYAVHLLQGTEAGTVAVGSDDFKSTSAMPVKTRRRERFLAISVTPCHFYAKDTGFIRDRSISLLDQ